MRRQCARIASCSARVRVQPVGLFGALISSTVLRAVTAKKGESMPIPRLEGAGTLRPTFRAIWRNKGRVGSGSVIMIALLMLYPGLSAVRLVGTDLDPQGLDAQRAALVAAGAEVHLSNASATRRAIQLIEGAAR